MRAIHSCQKNYADWRHRPLEFEVGDQVFLRVSPTKGVARFGMTRKLSLRYIRPYPIIQRIGKVAYRLELPPKLPRVHNVFHVSQLQKYILNPSHIIKSDPIRFQEDLSYEKQPVRILDRQEKHLCRKTVPLWANYKISEATWKPEQEMRDKYPHLFI